MQTKNEAINNNKRHKNRTLPTKLQQFIVEADISQLEAMAEK